MTLWEEEAMFMLAVNRLLSSCPKAEHRFRRQARPCETVIARVNRTACAIVVRAAGPGWYEFRFFLKERLFSFQYNRAVQNYKNRALREL